jgi:heme/copper-type cytochrome/quinol oxidase subunit 2
MQNLVFYLAFIALLLFLFDLSGGWGALFITGFETFQLVDWVKFGFSAFFFILAMVVLGILLVIGITWVFSKKPKPMPSKTNASGIVAVSNAITAVCELIISLVRKKDSGKKN